MTQEETSKKKPIPEHTRKRVDINQIDRPDDARELDEKNVENLQRSITKHGLLQAIVVVAHGDRYWCVIGNHRFVAERRNGSIDIEAVVWPEGTSRQKLLVASMDENSVRKNETMQDTLHRVTALAAYHNCNFSTAAGIANVAESTLSKINKSLSTLCPKALQIVSNNKIGVAVAYETAKAAKDHAQQTNWLNEHAAGRMTRDAIIEAGKANGSSQRSKKVTLDLEIEGVTFKMSFSSDVEYKLLFDVLSTLTKRLTKQCKLNHPVDLLPRLMMKVGA